jgi:intracellular multiplication protein IcmW
LLEILGKLMANFDKKAVYEFWRSFQDPTIFKVINLMESVEDWAVDDDPEVEAALSNLALAMQDLGKIELAEEDLFIKIVSHLKTGRGLSLLMHLNMAYSGAAAKVLSHAESVRYKDGQEHTDYFLRRNLIFERLRLIGRVFSADRFKLVTDAFEGSDE